MSDPFAHDDAAYVLGALGPAQRRAFEAHLSECASCARSVRELAGIPGLLSGVGPEMFETALFEDAANTPPVPETLLPRLMREVRRRRRRTRFLATLGAAAAAVLVAVVAVLALGGGPDQPTVAPIGPAQEMSQVGQAVLTGDVAMQSVAWGTRLRLSCRYAGEYVDPDASYALVVRTRAGDEEQVATWRALASRTATLDAATAARVDDIASLDVVVTGTGRRLLSLDLTSG